MSGRNLTQTNRRTLRDQSERRASLVMRTFMYVPVTERIGNLPDGGRRSVTGANPSMAIRHGHAQPFFFEYPQQTDFSFKTIETTCAISAIHFCNLSVKNAARNSTTQTVRAQQGRAIADARRPPDPAAPTVWHSNNDW